MNKLVSKNPVLRFKLGKLIVKALLGNYIPTENTTNATDRLLATGKFILDSNGNLRKLSDMLKSGIIVNGKDLNDKRREYKTSSNTKSTISLSKKSYFQNAYKNADLEKEVASMGGIKAVLKMLGFTEGNGLDGIWGKNTQNAWNSWKNKLSLNSPETTSIPQISYTPGIMNNALFSSTGNTTTDFNIAKLSLIPKLKETKPFVPGTYRVSSIYDRNYIRGNRDDYSNVDEYWDYLNNNRDSTNFKLFLNIMRTNDGNLNKEAFYRIMNRYGISGNLGRRDSGRLAKLLNDLNLIGTEGTDVRNSFIDSYNKAYDANYNDLYIKDAAQKLGWMLVRKQGGQLVSKNPIKRFKNKK